LLFSNSLAVLALSLSILLIGINSQSAWLFWLAGLLISAVLVSWAFSLWEVRRLSLSRSHRPEVGEDELLEITLRISNRGRFSRHLLEVIDEDPCATTPRSRPYPKRARKPLKVRLNELLDPSPPREAPAAREGGPAAFLIPSLEPGGQAVFSYRRGGLRRGIYGDWPGFFYSEGVIGLARHASRVRPESRLVVLPSFVELNSFPLVDSFLHPQETSHDFAPKGPGIDYFGVREFKPGDALRHVHWRTTARRGELVVKEFAREAGTALTILLDNQEHGEPLGEGKARLDCCTRLAASVARYAHYAGHPVSLAAHKGRQAFMYDVPNFQAALRWLAVLTPEGAAGCEQQVENLRSELEPGSFLCCIFPAKPIDFDRLASALPPLCHLSLVFVDLRPSGHGSRLETAGSGAESLVSELIGSPFEGLFSVSLYREGDDMKECLERPLAVFGNSLALKT